MNGVQGVSFTYEASQLSTIVHHAVKGADERCAQIIPGAVRQKCHHLRTSRNLLFGQYSRAVCANFLAGKSHPARKFHFHADTHRSSAIHRVKMRLKLVENLLAITISAHKTTRRANSKKPLRKWRILDFDGTMLE
jgi:hypothetical protein